MPGVCRDCELPFESGARCPSCRSPRVVTHPELDELSIAHMDCDAFYAAIEKRDNPDLRTKPVIVGGTKRGVVSTACYIARIKGVHSAMPMFRAKKLCPEAIIVRPRMEAYVQASRRIRTLMDELTPVVEPLSLDEAFLDLTGTEKLHGAVPAVLLARLVNRIEREVGVTGSIGLSHNKFLAKLASDLEKPKGFSVIGKAETGDFLSDLPVSLIWGVGATTQARLHQNGIYTFRDLRRLERNELMATFGEWGVRLWNLAQGKDYRRVLSTRSMKSISNELTFFEDTSDEAILDGHIWRLSERVSDRAKAKGNSGRIVTLKAKRSNFKLLTKRTTLEQPTQMADLIYVTSRSLFDAVKHQGPFRLIGVGISGIDQAAENEIEGDLLDPNRERRVRSELATDRIRKKFGKNAILKGRSLR